MSADKKPRMYDSIRWRKERARHLYEFPLCIMCASIGRDEAATVVDHIVPHNGDPVLFWDPTNWQSLCPSCHSGIKRLQEHHGHSPAAGVDGLPIDNQHPWFKAQP